jgi:BASS family bile acid:Na+ symporter
MKELLQNIDGLHVALTQGNMHVVNVILAFIMFGVALGIRLNSFKDIIKNPKSALVGIFMQWVALPAVTFLVTIILNPFITPMVAIGMILVASCPGGNISNFISSLSKGNVELSVSMTALTTLFAPIITPFNFWLWGSLYGKYTAAHNHLPALEIPFSEMLFSIGIILGIPIILGIICARVFPRLSIRMRRPTTILSIILFLVMVTVSFAQVLRAIEPNWETYLGILCVILVVIIHNASALATGYYGARLMRLREANIRTITIETGIQNSGLGLALLLNPNIFPADTWASNGGMVLITALWGVWHIVSGLLISRYFRRRPLA